MMVVTADTPGYIPNMLANKPKTAISLSVAVTPPERTSEVKLFYQTSPESDMFCLICHKNFKNYGPLMNHLRKIHGKTLILTCEKCETNFDNGKAFGLHISRKTDCSKFKKK